MEKERKITAPEGCEIEKFEILNGVAVVTFREKERKLPKSWEEFCEMYDVDDEECFIDVFGLICNAIEHKLSTLRNKKNDKNLLPDRATAEAVLALCQLIQLRNAYNGDWVPDFTNPTQDKFIIEFCENEICCSCVAISNAALYFKTEGLCNDFLENFRDLIEKLKPLYGIKEGGEE